MRFSRWRLADAGLKLTGFKWVLLCNGVVGSDHNFFTASRRDVHLTIYQRVLGAGSGVPTGRDFFLSAARRWNAGLLSRVPPGPDNIRQKRLIHACFRARCTVATHADVP